MITNFLSRIPFDTPFWKELFFVFRLVLSEILFSPLASFLSLLTPRSIFVCHLYIVKEYCKKTIPPCLITPRLARFNHLQSVVVAVRASIAVVDTDSIHSVIYCRRFVRLWLWRFLQKLKRILFCIADTLYEIFFFIFHSLLLQMNYCIYYTVETFPQVH